MEKKHGWIKFDARPDFQLMYFPDTEQGREEMERWWHRNWLIGCHPKLTKVKKLPKP